MLLYELPDAATKRLRGSVAQRRQALVNRAGKRVVRRPEKRYTRRFDAPRGIHDEVGHDIARDPGALQQSRILALPECPQLQCKRWMIAT